jgi:glycosyltransferase involved in cell wall biosynthesis
VLDAFRAGTAVLTSDATSLPEVAGGAAELTDPRSAGWFAASLAGVVGDDARRAALAAAGRARVEAEFDLDRNAERLVALFRETAA